MVSMKGMRALYLALAALLSIGAIVVRLLGMGNALAIAAIIAAAIFLGLGLWEHAKKQEPKPIELDEEQLETLERMKSEGNHSGAIRQVQLWFRFATAEDARRIVHDL